MDKEEKKTFVQLLLFAIALAIIVAVGLHNRKKYFSEINVEFEVTEGWITSYNDRRFSDNGHNRIIGYSYSVGGILYSRKAVTEKFFIECEDLSELCKKKRFRVAYSKKDPSKSLIDFNTEVQGLSKIEKPKDVFGFR